MSGLRRSVASHISADNVLDRFFLRLIQWKEIQLQGLVVIMQGRVTLFKPKERPCVRS